jgi:hypothetical protein
MRKSIANGVELPEGIECLPGVFIVSEDAGLKELKVLKSGCNPSSLTLGTQILPTEALKG